MFPSILLIQVSMVGLIVAGCGVKDDPSPLLPATPSRIQRVEKPVRTVAPLATPNPLLNPPPSEKR